MTDTRIDGSNESQDQSWGETRWWNALPLVSSFDHSPYDEAEDDDSSGEVADARAAMLEAARVLATGGTVAFPTETVYGLGADARNTEAVQRIFQAKGRPSDNPLIVHIAEQGQLEGLVVGLNEVEQALMKHFWPGPLTIVLPVKQGAVSPLVTAGLSTVGVRMPHHEIALQLIAAAGCPVAAPSANRSGRPSPTKARHVGEDLAGLISGIVDGGPTGVGVESTVVQVDEQGDIIILRPGGVTMEQLQSLGLGEVKLDQALLHDTTKPSLATDVQNNTEEQVFVPKSPGMKYKHYAPSGRLQIVRGENDKAVSAYIQAELLHAKERQEKTGVLAFEEHIAEYDADVVISLGKLSSLETAAHRLYDALRSMDEREVTYILAESCEEHGVGVAIMNRLLKAAGHDIVDI
ncbi:Threonylcarbamoyl-AMP synthase [compost metagenome]